MTSGGSSINWRHDLKWWEVRQWFVTFFIHHHNWGKDKIQAQDNQITTKANIVMGVIIKLFLSSIPNQSKKISDIVLEMLSWQDSVGNWGSDCSRHLPPSLPSLTTDSLLRSQQSTVQMRIKLIFLETSLLEIKMYNPDHS